MHNYYLRRSRVCRGHLLDVWPRWDERPTQTLVISHKGKDIIYIYIYIILLFMCVYIYIYTYLSLYLSLYIYIERDMFCLMI